MTTETRNEAAERLREHMADFHGNCPWVGEDHIALLDIALAAERRATVERIREACRLRMIATSNAVALDPAYLVAMQSVGAILDEEAAR